jgi:hypothetical protein
MCLPFSERSSRWPLKWKLIANLPCTVELMKVSNVVVKFYEFGQ